MSYFYKRNPTADFVPFTNVKSFSARRHERRIVRVIERVNRSSTASESIESIENSSCNRPAQAFPPRPRPGSTCALLQSGEESNAVEEMESVSEDFPLVPEGTTVVEPGEDFGAPPAVR